MSSSLLALPDSCLLKVLQCCAADHSLFSAARAHSRLRQAAVLALSSIKAITDEQQQLDGVLLYIERHGQHVASLDLANHTEDCTLAIRQLPRNLQLSSLHFYGFHLQLQPGDGFRGVLGAAAAGLAALKRLRLDTFELLDGSDGALAAALSQLPAGLEELSIDGSFYPTRRDHIRCTAGALQHLQGLTCLGLTGIDFGDEEDFGPALQAMTRLVELRLELFADEITVAMFASATHLTRLELSVCVIEPGALAVQTQLLHLSLGECLEGAALLSDLQHLQQLTHLKLRCTCYEGDDHNPPAAAYSALTASSSLQHLDIRSCTLPAGALQHLFPAGRQLPALRELDISWVDQPDGSDAPAPAGSRLASCCPGLQSVHMEGLYGSTEQRGVFQQARLVGERAALTEERDNLAHQVSGLVAEVGHLQQELAAAQGAAADARAAAAEAQQTIAALQAELAAAKAAAAVAAAARDGTAAGTAAVEAAAARQW